MNTKEDSDDARTEEPKSKIQVHSANSWETADLGDKQRNEKFMRLMGASKKEHSGKIIIGDKNQACRRERKDEKHMSEKLEEQYEHSMEHRLVGGKRGHLGLGYHAAQTEKQEQDKDEFVEEVGVEAKEEESEEDANEDDTEGNEDRRNEEHVNADKKDKGGKEDQRKRESLDKNIESDNKKMKFVKSS